jgi:hypothetical protein
MIYQATLNTMMGDLQANWNDMLGADGALESDQVRVVREVSNAIKELTETIERENRAPAAELVTTVQAKVGQKIDDVRTKVRKVIGGKVAGALAAAVELAKELAKDKLGIDLPKEVEPDLSNLEAQIQLYLDKLAFTSRFYQERAATYRQLMSMESGGVLTMFTRTRAQVHAYEEHNDLEAVAGMRDEAIRALQDWAARANGAARADAEEFVKKITEVLERDWNASEDLREQFEARFRGIFTAQLTTDTIETLIEKAMFSNEVEILLNYNAADRLDQAQRALTGTVEDDTARAVQPLIAAVPDFPAELIPLVLQLTDSFRSYLREQLKSQVDQAIRLLIGVPNWRFQLSCG